MADTSKPKRKPFVYVPRDPELIAKRLRHFRHVKAGLAARQIDREAEEWRRDRQARRKS